MYYNVAVIMDAGDIELFGSTVSLYLTWWLILYIILID